MPQTAGHMEIIDRNTPARLVVARALAFLGWKQYALNFYARRVFVRIGTKEMAVYP